MQRNTKIVAAPLPNGVSMATKGARPCVAVSNKHGDLNFSEETSWMMLLHHYCIWHTLGGGYFTLMMFSMEKAACAAHSNTVTLLCSIQLWQTACYTQFYCFWIRLWAFPQLITFSMFWEHAGYFKVNFFASNEGFCTGWHMSRTAGGQEDNAEVALWNIKTVLTWRRALVILANSQKWHILIFAGVIITPFCAV